MKERSHGRKSDSPVEESLSIDEPVTESWLWPAGMVIATLALGRALLINNGHLHADALLWLNVSLGSLAIALWKRNVGFHERAGRLHLPALLAIAVVLQFLEHVTTIPGIYLRVEPKEVRSFFHGMFFVAIFVLASLLSPSENVRKIGVVGFLLCFFWLGLWMIRASPNPAIDVHLFQREGAAALLAGNNPYELRFADIYGTGTNAYGPERALDGKLPFGFVYPPLSLIMVLPGHLLGGDYRYAHLAAYTLTGALMAYARPGAPGPFAVAAAALYLFSPRSLFVIEQGWTEPLVIFLLALTVFVAMRAPKLLPVAVGLFLASKQYAFLCLPLALFVLPRPWRWPAAWRLLWRAGLVAIVVTAPLALWNIGEFLNSVALLQFKQPYRANGLSYLSWIHGTNTPPVWQFALSFLLALAGLALAFWKMPRSPAGYAFGTAVVYMGFFVFNKQSFCNHYFVPLGALCLALAVTERPEPVKTVVAGTA